MLKILTHSIYRVISVIPQELQEDPDDDGAWQDLEDTGKRVDLGKAPIGVVYGRASYGLCIHAGDAGIPGEPSTMVKRRYYSVDGRTYGTHWVTPLINSTQVVGPDLAFVFPTLLIL